MGRRFQLLDDQGEIVGHAATLIDAVRDCPKDGGIYDTLTQRYLEPEAVFARDAVAAA